MKRMILLIAAVLAGIGCLAGCSRSEKEETIDFGMLQNDSGEFRFYGLEWGCSVEDVEKALEITFERPYTDDGTIAGYYSPKPLAFAKTDGNVSFEYNGGRLQAVSVRFKPDEEKSEAFWENLKKSLCSLYGTVSEDARGGVPGDNNAGQNLAIQGKSCLWESQKDKHTALSISSVSVNGEFKYIVLNVYIIPSDDKAGE